MADQRVEIWLQPNIVAGADQIQIARLVRPVISVARVRRRRRTSMSPLAAKRRGRARSLDARPANAIAPRRRRRGRSSPARRSRRCTASPASPQRTLHVSCAKETADGTGRDTGGRDQAGVQHVDRARRQVFGRPRCREERQDAEPAREVERAAAENHGWRMEESSVSATDPRFRAPAMPGIWETASGRMERRPATEPHGRP